MSDGLGFDISESRFKKLKIDLDETFDKHEEELETPEGWQAFSDELEQFQVDLQDEDERLSYKVRGLKLPSLEEFINFINNYRNKHEIFLKLRLLDDAIVLPYINDTDAESARWASYKKYLEKQKGFSSASIAGIRETAELALTLHAIPNKIEENSVIKGLGVGYVQSGKTASYAGLMCMAADNGFNVIIVLAGVMTNLREQTHQRLEQELTSTNRACPRDLGDRAWKFVSEANVHEGRDRNIQVRINTPNVIVTLKNVPRLKKLKEWLSALVQTSQTPIKMLIIDDECDQAGINTRKTPNPSEEGTAVHRAILDIIYMKGVYNTTYMGYTATPYASILNDGPYNKDGSLKQNLYPKDFIIPIPKSNIYWSPQMFFGDDQDSSLYPGVNTFDQDEWNRVDYWVQQALPKEFDLPEGVSAEELLTAPQSIKSALAWFIASLAVLRHRDDKRVISMLVHNSHLIKNAELLATRLTELYDALTLDELKSIYLQTAPQVNKDSFAAHWPAYERLEHIQRLPEWSEIEAHAERILNTELRPCHDDSKAAYVSTTGLTLAVDVSASVDPFQEGESTAMRLRYPSPIEQDELNEAQGFLVVGGNTLSRGLTIEGLVSTWFARPVGTADTLMQMGRWFGYRVGYELLPRLWISEPTTEEFGYVAHMESALHENIREYALSSFRNASEVAPIIRLHPSASIMPAARNKIKAAVSSMTWMSQSPQTLYFDKDDEIVNHNWSCLQDFITRLATRSHAGPSAQTKHNVVWRDIPLSEIKAELLNKLKLSEKESPKSLTRAAIESIDFWLGRITGDAKKSLESWTVALVSTDPTAVNSKTCELGDFKVGLHSRSAVGRNGQPIEEGRLYIKSLRSPTDLFADDTEGVFKAAEIKERSAPTSLRMRKEKLYPNGDVPPMLLIYPLNGTVTVKSSQTSDRDGDSRVGYECANHLVGLSIIFPSIEMNLDENTYSVIMKG